MRITCPDCRSEYAFDGDRISSRGTRVKCSACEHVFTVYRPDELGLSDTGRDLPRLSTTDDPLEGRSLFLRQEGKTYPVKDVALLQRWIVEKRVLATDEVSLDGENWQQVSRIAELRSFFTVLRQLRETRRELQYTRERLKTYVTGEYQQLSGDQPRVHATREVMQHLDGEPQRLDSPLVAEPEDVPEPESAEFGQYVPSSGDYTPVVDGATAGDDVVTGEIVSAADPEDAPAPTPDDGPELDRTTDDGDEDTTPSGAHGRVDAGFVTGETPAIHSGAADPEVTDPASVTLESPSSRIMTNQTFGVTGEEGEDPPPIPTAAARRTVSEMLAQEVEEPVYDPSAQSVVFDGPEPVPGAAVTGDEAVTAEEDEPAPPAIPSLDRPPRTPSASFPAFDDELDRMADSLSRASGDGESGDGGDEEADPAAAAETGPIEGPDGEELAGEDEDTGDGDAEVVGDADDVVEDEHAVAAAADAAEADAADTDAATADAAAADDVAQDDGAEAAAQEPEGAADEPWRRADDDEDLASEADSRAEDDEAAQSAADESEDVDEAVSDDERPPPPGRYSYDRLSGDYSADADDADDAEQDGDDEPVAAWRASEDGPDGPSFDPERRIGGWTDGEPDEPDPAMWGGDDAGQADDGPSWDTLARGSRSSVDDEPSPQADDDEPGEPSEISEDYNRFEASYREHNGAPRESWEGDEFAQRFDSYADEDEDDEPSNLRYIIGAGVLVILVVVAAYFIVQYLQSGGREEYRWVQQDEPAADAVGDADPAPGPAGVVPPDSPPDVPGDASVDAPAGPGDGLPDGDALATDEAPEPLAEEDPTPAPEPEEQPAEVVTTPPIQLVEVDTTPKPVVNHTARAEELARDGLYAEAIQEYQAALNANRSDARAHRGLGWAYIEIGSNVQAAEHFREAVLLDAMNPENHYGLGLAYEGLGRTEAAINEYQTYIGLAPDGREVAEVRILLRRLLEME